MASLIAEELVEEVKKGRWRKGTRRWRGRKREF
jgi:hypothetical protein